MGKFFDRFANLFGYVKSVAVSTGSSLGLPAWPSAKTTNYIEAYKGWVYSAVKARAKSVAKIKLHLYKVVDRKTGETEEVVEHEVLSLLRSVNPWMTSRDLWEATQAYKDLAGEAFWYLVRGGKEGLGPIIQIWVLRPDWITIETDSQNFIKAYTYSVPGNSPITIKKEDIIHHKEFNPSNPYRGMSIVKAAATTIDADDYAEQYNRKFFVNSALPALVLSTEQKLDESIIKRMRKQWENEYGGVDRAHKLAILEGGLKIEPFSISHKDMEFIQGQGMSRDKILALFQVPKTMLGITEDVTVSNAEAMDAMFAKHVTDPLMESIKDTLNEFLLPKYKNSDDLFFDYDDPVPENQANKLERYKALFSIGAMSPNEIRAAEGLDEVPGLDNVYLPFSVIAVNGENSAGEEVPAKTAKGKGVKKSIPAKTLKNKLRDDLTEKITGEIGKKVMGAMVKVHKDEAETPAGTSLSYDQQTIMWKRFISKADPAELKYISQLRKNFDRQEKETLKRLENTQKALRPSDVDSVLFDLSVENKVSSEVLVPILKSFFEESGSDSLDSLGLSSQVFDTTTATVKEFFKVTALKGIKAMNRTTKSELRRVLAQAVADGKGIPEISADIKRVFRIANNVRALRIARTEVIKAGNTAAVEAYKQSGVVVGKQWYTALDEQVCQWCQPMQGRTKSLTKDFFNQGDSFKGNEGGELDLSFDSVGQPPLHPNCRCTIVPIIHR